MSSVVSRVDEVQRRHAILGFPWAVVKRYVEDRGNWLGALISYYGFFSLYPLLVAFTTIATWLFNDRPQTLQRILSSVWSKVPFATDQLAAQVSEQVNDLSVRVGSRSCRCSCPSGVRSASYACCRMR